MTKLTEDILHIVLSLLILTVGVATYVLLIKLKAPPEKKEVVVEKTLVRTTVVEPHSSGLIIPVDGVVVPYREIQVAAEVSGIVEEKSPNCRAGKYVREGEVLFRIERDYYQKELEILQKEHQQADRTIKELDIEKANVKKLIANAKAQEKIEQDQEERYRSIRESSARLLTEREYDLQQLALLGVQNQLITLYNQETMLETKRLRLERAMEETQLRIDKAKLDLERTEITAPINGMVVQDLCEEDSFVTKGTVVAKIEDISKVEVRCNLQMDQMYWVWRQPTQAVDPSDYYRVPQTPVKVFYRLAGKDLVWNGMLTRYDGIGVDEMTRTVPCRVVIDNPRSEISGTAQSKRTWSGPPALVRGMYVTVNIETKPEDVLLQIPELALKPNGTVWVVRQGKLYIQSVDVVEVEAGKVIFTQNGDEKEKLRPGDRVVITPLPGVYNEMPVTDESTRPKGTAKPNREKPESTLQPKSSAKSNPMRGTNTSTKGAAK